MSLSKDLAKKLYQTHEAYQDAMRQISNKALWNRVLTKYPRLAEFFLTGRGKRNLTTYERSLSEFIIQSEFVKPYKAPDYVESEYSWDPPTGTTNPPSGGGSPNNPPGEEGPPWTPGNYVCDATLETGCWCEDDDNGQDFIITGTYPIVELVITFGDAKLLEVTGYGTNKVTGKIKGGKENVGMVTIEVIMQYPLGYCDSNVNIFECSEEECCESQEFGCHEDNPETIGGSSNQTIVFTGGLNGDYTYEVTGTDAWLNSGLSITETTSSNPWITVYTGASACGPISVTATDKCDREATCSLRCTNGVWGAAIPGSCGGCEGAPDGRPLGCPTGVVCRKTCDLIRSSTRFGQCQGCSGSCNCWDADCSHCNGIPACATGYDGCIPFSGCGSGLMSCGVSGNAYTCYDPCDNPPGAGGWDRGLCYVNSGGYPYYQEWECPP